MFNTMKRLSVACECLTSSIEALRDMVANHHDFLASSGNVEARVEELERQRTLFEAEIHGELALSKTEYRKASSAEKRAQTASKADDGPDWDGKESPEEFKSRYEAFLSDDNGERDTVTMPPLRPPVANALSIRSSLSRQKRGG